MRALRGIGVVVLYVLAGVGVLSGVMWGATALGLVQPLIVVSGSMSPGIRTGDLVISVPKPIADVSSGDVITLTSPLTNRLVTHRVVTISPDTSGVYRVTMKGDANDEPDNGEYLVAANQSPPSPWFVILGAGRIVETLSRPGVSIPLLIALAALIGLATLSPRSDEREDDSNADHDSGSSSKIVPPQETATARAESRR